MVDENVFMKRVLELVENSKTQRDGVGIALVKEFNLPGKHTATRLTERLLGVTISQMLKLKFIYPENWKSMIPKLNLVESISLADRIEQLRVSNFKFKDAKDILQKEFNISEMELVRRVRSITQKSLAEYFEPTDDEIQEALIRANTSEEFKEILGADNAFMHGFFDKRLGVSNFKTAKASCLYKMKIPNINPCTSDNEAIIFSQVIGDGSYDSYRKSIKIQHGIKQLGYLRWKVSLLKNAYPTLAGVENIQVRQHTQGHEYAEWYSRKLPDHVSNKLDTYSFRKLVFNLTPLGMLLVFLDDGCLFWKDTKSITICLGIEKEKHEVLAEYLSTYNIHSIAYDKTCTIAQKVEIVKFINTFVKPFIKSIPASMQYKTEIMI